MKRHRSLQPLSRDHHEVLLHARELRAAADAAPGKRRRAVELFRAFWGGWPSEHFDLEDRLLPPLIPEAADADRLLEEHAEIHALAKAFLAGTGGETPAPAAMRRLATRLHDHVRWEERHLFPALEEAAGRESLRALEAATSRLEAARPRSCRRRP